MTPVAELSSRGLIVWGLGSDIFTLCVHVDSTMWIQSLVLNVYHHCGLMDWDLDFKRMHPKGLEKKCQAMFPESNIGGPHTAHSPWTPSV